MGRYEARVRNIKMEDGLHDRYFSGAPNNSERGRQLSWLHHNLLIGMGFDEPARKKHFFTDASRK